MLKFIMYIMSVFFFIENLISYQIMMFMFSFIFGLYSLNMSIYSSLGFSLGVDSLSYVLILLSAWIIILVIMSSQKIFDLKNYISEFLLILGFLFLSLVLTFSCLDFMMFYIFFEMSLIPTFVMILGWGYQPERIQAGIYLMFYTLFASLPLLLSLVSLYMKGGSLEMNLSSKNVNMGSSFVENVWYFSSIMAFMVKLPVYSVHLWLPKAHVEAPVAGSMILAGVLLKLGGYGLIRILPIFSYCHDSFSWLWVSMGLAGGGVVSLMCLRQIDMKSLIAYSSVAHMGLVLCGLMTFGWWGYSGAVIVMVGHGLCSSGLFCLANMSYERIGSRSLLINKGLLNIMPNMSMWWFLLSIGNMSAPPSLNLMGEICLIISLVSWSSLSILMLMMLSFFSAGYSLYMYSLSQHGKFFSSIYSCCSGKVREYLVLFLHWFPLNFLILKGEFLL
uniref:NADH-ubiquinone oxidoreductase chain 4 n=1 Tax=Lysmata vittata TaxID=749979 RepID=A0A7D5U8G8_9EUCA|nr:NADH dehydrogenase subunit 4 [Lysmata vittata]QLI42514.1 NADH dehydrogenase subunit 4 [Lysmata vittata]QQP21712.1 NADH dehydrogenase subunit 4 [Lysmata vittata]